MKKSFRERLWIAALIAALPMIALADDEPTYSVELESQPLSESLKSFADQTGLQVVFFSEFTEGVQAVALNGDFTANAALDTLLDESGLTYEYINDKAVTVKPVSEEEGSRDSGNSQPTPILIAQNQTSAQSTQTSNPRESPNDEPAPEALEEIVVVGSRIRGVGAAVGANVITLDRAHIEQTGLVTTQEILQSIPQNFGGGANEVTQNLAFGQFVPNAGFASGVNLRGLGTESTLLLVNGRRSAPGGRAGGFVDLNSIPASAIERVEILPDGASAIYGSDAIGGVVNVVLQGDYEGVETRLRYAPGSSDIDEIQLGQIIGTSWDSGNILLTYEYYDRSELKSEDRAYTRDSDLRDLGGTDHSVPISNPGNIIRYTRADGTSENVQFAIPAGQDGTALTPDDLLSGVTNLQNTRDGTYVLPRQERHSASLLLAQEVTDSIELFADLRYSTRDFENRFRGVTSQFSSGVRMDVPSSNAFFVDPFGDSTSLRLLYSFVDDYGTLRTTGTVDTIGATMGAKFDLSDTWRLEFYGSFNAEDTETRNDRRVNTALLTAALADPDPATAFNPFGDGSHTNPETLAAIEGFQSTDEESELAVVNVHADGELFDLPGGAAKLAIGAQFNDQTLESSPINFISTPEPVPGLATDIFKLDRDITAVFGEVYLPFVSDSNGRPGLRDLAVSIAGRYEDYSDFGDTFNPKFGVSWSPLKSLRLRSTYGTSFRAPLLAELNDSSRTFQGFSGVPDPASPTGTSTALFRFGNNADLMPEEGTTWTAGFDIEPELLPGLSVGITYFETDIDQLIQIPTTNLFQPLNEPESFAAIIQRVPDDASLEAVAAILNDPGCFFCTILFTPDDIDAIIDLRLNNLNKMEVAGFDFDVAYAFDTAIGSFNLSLYASHLLDFKEEAFANGPLEDQLDTIDKPNSLKVRGNLSWNRGGLHTTIFANHIGDYTSDFDSTCKARPEGYCPVSSWTTWDLDIGYDFGEQRSGFLESARVSVNVRNVFDKDPPFVELGSLAVAFDPLAANPLGQFVAIRIVKVW